MNFTSVVVPELLKNKCARDLNDKLIQNNKIFAFVDEPEYLLKKTPSTYSESFEQYSIALYKLYHDYGMHFFNSYLCEAANILNKPQYSMHVRFVNALRAIVAHASSPNNCEYAFSKLKEYYFKDDPSFTDTYKCWDDFWHNAPEIHWKKLMYRVISDSNKLYNNLLCKIADNDPDVQNITENIKENFKNGTYKNYNEEVVLLYEKSLDCRFLKFLCDKAKYTFVWEDEKAAKKEMKRLYNQKEITPEDIDDLHKQNKLSPQELKSEIISVIKEKLNDGVFYNSETLSGGIVQIVADEIRKQISMVSAIVADNFFD